MLVDKKAKLIDPVFVSSSDHGGVFATTGPDAITLLGNDPSPPLQIYYPKISFIPQFFSSVHTIFTCDCHQVQPFTMDLCAKSIT